MQGRYYPDRLMWQALIDMLSPAAQRDNLATVLRSRRRAFPIMINTRTYLVPRATVRDYLRAILK